MPSKSQAQARMMQAVANSPSFAKKVGISQSVGKDYFAADRKAGTSGLPARKANGGKVMSTHNKEPKMKDRLDVQRRKAEKLSGQTTGKRSNLGAEMSASPKPAPRMQVSPPSANRVAVPQGYAKGGKVSCHAKGGKVHADAAMDKKLIRSEFKRMEKKEDEGYSRGGAVPPHKAHHHMKHSPRRQGM